MYQVTDKERQYIANAIEGMSVDCNKHDYFDEGHCVMEIVANFEPSETSDPRYCHTDHPYHADPYLTCIMISVNDALDGNTRQMLKELVPWLVGSAITKPVSLKRLSLLVAAYIRKLVPSLSNKLCQKVCPVAKMVENQKYGEASDYMSLLVRALEAPDATLNKIYGLVTTLETFAGHFTDEPSVVGFVISKLITHKSGFAAESSCPHDHPLSEAEVASNLRFFIDTMLDVLKTTT